MAIIKEYFDINGTDFIRTYSDSNCFVVRDGIEYAEACDPAKFGREYTEGKHLPFDESENEEYAEVGKILMGVIE